MPESFDVIVLGVGGMGSAACYELARRGRRVLGLEQFALAHDRGSSHGHTRIIRTAYAEGVEYVPLVRRAFARWYELEQATGRHLLTECPCLNVGPATSEHVAGVRASVRAHALEAEELSGAEINRRYPAFNFPTEYVGIVERAAGFLYVEECVRAHCDAALSLGATIRANEPVLSWRADASGAEVTTAKSSYRAAKLVITAGAWATKLLAGLGAPLKVMRQTLLWFKVEHASNEVLFRRDNFPIFIADVPEGAFYGVPMLDARGVKLARHYNAPELNGPEEVDWNVTVRDVDELDRLSRRFFSADYTPGFSSGQVCMYTVTPDHHFVIDVHPELPNVSVACGFSGHGFKFASAVGEVLADLADTGRTNHDIGLFRATRFAGRQ